MAAFPEEIAFAVEALRRGEVVAYPTETSYGLAVNAFDELALRRIADLKEREAGKAISVLVVGDLMLRRLAREVPPAARKLMARHWPGPLTIALPARRGLPRMLVQDGCVAVRESPEPTARGLCEAFGAPITATSANLAGQPALCDPHEVDEAFGGRVRVLDGGVTPGGAPSTLVRVRGSRVEVLRQGAIEIG